MDVIVERSRQVAGVLMAYEDLIGEVGAGGFP